MQAFTSWMVYIIFPQRKYTFMWNWLEPDYEILPFEFQKL